MRNVAIVPVVREPEDSIYTCKAVQQFIKNGVTVWMENVHNGEPYTDNVVLAQGDSVFKNAELIVVLGGDGTILRAAEQALNYNLPILGINLGRVGYMAELEKDELCLIDNIFSGEYHIENRMILSIYSVDKNDKTLHIGDVLNDVIVSKGNYSRCIDIDLRADDKPVRSIRGDGLIIATPTGSTAYSMSAGGSVLDPTLECICATPIVPISRYACPLIFSGNSVLEVVHNDDRAEQLSIVLDGVIKHYMATGEKIVVKKADKFVKMLSLKDEGFFETLNNKISKYELKK